MNLKALALGLIIVGAGGWGLHVATKGPVEAPSLKLYSSRGKLFDLAENTGKVVVIDFFATWCPPCRAAIPSLQQISEAYADKGVVVVGVQVSDDEDAAGLMKQLGASYPVLVNGNDVAKNYGVRGLPTLVIVGKTGTVVHRSTGWGSQSQKEVLAAVNEALR